MLGVVQTETFEDPSNGKVLLSTKYGYDEDVPCEADLIKHTSGRFVLTSNTSGNAKTWQGYDQYGNIVCRVHPEGGIYRILYDASGNWLKQITNPVGMTSKFEYYGVDGIRADAGPVGFQRSIVDVNGDAIISEYDGFGSKTREILPAGGWTAWEYTINAGLQVVHASDATGEETYETRDGLGRVIFLTSRGPELRWIDAQMIYGSSGQIMRQTGPAVRGVSVNPVVYKRDLMGRTMRRSTPTETAP